MRILIDTNVVIPLEDSTRVLEESLSKLVRLASENGHQLLAHPASYDDIARDPDKKRRDISLSRLRKYSILADPPRPTPAELSRLGLIERDDNDRVDNEILYALIAMLPTSSLPRTESFTRKHCKSELLTEFTTFSKPLLSLSIYTQKSQLLCRALKRCRCIRSI